jgi:hypothetical protein
MMAGWTWLDWARLASGLAVLFYGLYRLRHAGYYQRKAQQKRDARGGGVSRYNFAELAPSQRGDGWSLIFLGAILIALALVQR